MKNVKLTIAYDGSDFSGFQIQPDKRTIQGELEKALDKITGEKISLISCGRTDAGVHANMHVSNFKTNFDMPAVAYKYKLDQILPEDIVVIKSEEVDLNFHSRFDAKSKTYRYIVESGEYPRPFNRKYKEYIKYDLDIDLMRQAADKLIGEHDFNAFMKWNDYKGKEINTVRSIESVSIKQENNEYIFEFTAESFLHNQIRITMGLLIDIGRGFRSLDDIDKMFAGDIKRAAKTLGPEGLYLLEVNY